MGFLIDTSVLIDLQRARGNVSALKDEVGDEDLALSAVAASELMTGMYILEERIAAAKTPRQRAELEAARAKVERFIDLVFWVLPVVSFDMAIARRHARTGAKLHVAGQRVGDHDLLIGATALALDLKVLTADLRSFPKIPGLGIRKRAKPGGPATNPPRRRRAR